MAASSPSEAVRKSSHSSYDTIPRANGNVVLDKARLVGRRSTPDSEVVASSDDEPDKYPNDAASAASRPRKPTRRSSWLSEVHPQAPRRSSFANGGPLSPASSLPTSATPETGPWSGLGPTGVGRSHSGASPFAWGSGIWNNEPRKEPPARLTEVLPSPTSMVPPTSPLTGEAEPSVLSVSSRDQAGEATIPFAIPLHPTPKTYRSQSYSVGQLDHELPNGVPPSHMGSYGANRIRANQPAGLQHRPHRPSLLGDLSHEGTSLDRVREVDDDDDESTNGSGSQQGASLSAADARMPDHLSHEHHLRSHPMAVTRPMEHLRSASTDATAAAFGLGHDRAGVGRRLDESVPEESDYAVDEVDERSASGRPASSARRYSEYSSAFEGRFPAVPMPENRKLESLKKGHWQSSLGFGGIGDGPQSRRHSFADMPARNVSISSAAEHTFGADSLAAVRTSGNGVGPNLGNDASLRYRDGSGHVVEPDSSSYFSTVAASQGPGLHPTYHGENAYATGHLPSPQNGLPRSAGPGGGSATSAATHARAEQLLCVVTFKCCRSEVFYVQEGTGLEVNTGDMVIVEADRGTDLGTVAQVNVNWSQAKYWKERYAEEHYKWLMLFSRHVGQTENSGGLSGHPGLIANSAVAAAAVGGMPASSGPRGGHEASSGELKPKMIKRLAQNHEIQSLRDKEGNEAKAKRVCQQKVVEHRLQMEVLDAEFQVDWKKLTFYYFADAYINFNSLVTDLFKIYKTRIWMSAINPASFASPSAGLQPPSGIGPGALGVGSEAPHEGRAIHEGPALGSLHAYRGFSTGFNRPMEHGLDAVPPPAHALGGAYNYGPAPYGGPRVSPGGLGDYGRGLTPGTTGPPEMRPMDLGGFRPTAARGVSYFDQQGDPRSHLAANESLMPSFQGLSLGPR